MSSDGINVRRCTACDTDWPNSTDYEECPRGHGGTWITTAAASTYDWNQAKVIRNRHKEFLDYYNERERNRNAIIAEMEAQFA